MGRLLAATEVRSAQRYWHVPRSAAPAASIYPREYKPFVIGMMWQTMAQFQTWFGNAAFLAYGIQLMPLTSISERRDTVSWLEQVYAPYAESCERDASCRSQGWSILQYAILACVGHRELAAQKAIDLPPEVFNSAGGNGHSLTNTLWYIATRSDVAPLKLEPITPTDVNQAEEPRKTPPQEITCGCRDMCTGATLDRDAGGYTCRERITWLISAFGRSEAAACQQVGGQEYHEECGSCDPLTCAPTVLENKAKEAHAPDPACPPCTPIVCNGDANLCPRSLLAPFLCLSGQNKGGCSQVPWELDLCPDCCRLRDECFE